MPTPRPRVVVRGRFPSVYHPKEYTAWKEQLAETVKAQADLPPEALTGPLKVDVQVFASKPRTSKLKHPRPDCDNYGKGILDAITDSGRVWADDSQVVDLRIAKHWAAEDEFPGYQVTVAFQ